MFFCSRELQHRVATGKYAPLKANASKKTSFCAKQNNDRAHCTDVITHSYQKWHNALSYPSSCQKQNFLPYLYPSHNHFFYVNILLTPPQFTFADIYILSRRIFGKSVHRCLTTAAEDRGHRQVSTTVDPIICKTGTYFTNFN